ncbi:LysR family transcriptional regulator [Variovorax sp. Root434]|uniref:LysR family transcriptional regulator n=1 Tax=unclassified Variovorax TaxID=663243 RepID=UPI0006FDC8AC|nr:LysR family transcriptional regulator [Variovorax sp. Root434]KQX26594.1 LysR family transcriptional regulator [Variovorax sp. Root434]
MNVTLRQLRAFVLVARLGSFTRAAQAMHVTQSALSLLVRELETALDTRLFDRTTRAVTLTTAGSDFFPRAERVLADLQSAIAGIDTLVAKERGRVVVAAPLVLSSTYLPPILARFKAQYPGIEAVLQDTLPTQVLPQVRSGSADVGIGTFASDEADVKRTRLFSEAMVAVFPAGHAFGGAKYLTWADVVGQPMLALRSGSVFRDLTEAGFASAGMVLHPVAEANYAGSLIGMVSAGLGIAVLPGYAAKLTDESRIQCKRIEEPLIDREVSLVQRAGVSLSHAAQAFVDFIVEASAEPQPLAGRST